MVISNLQRFSQEAVLLEATATTYPNDNNTNFLLLYSGFEGRVNIGNVGITVFNLGSPFNFTTPFISREIPRAWPESISTDRHVDSRRYVIVFCVCCPYMFA